MAEISSIDVKRNHIMVNLKITKPEFELVSNATSNLLLLPTTPSFLSQSLTTGKLGNSNRIMLPKKILEKFEVKVLDKKVQAKTFRLDDELYLIIKLKRSSFGIPTFREAGE